jgi:hypothetical protein
MYEAAKAASQEMMEQPAQTAAKPEPRAAMAVVMRFDGFVNYLYPMLTNTNRQHMGLRFSHWADTHHLIQHLGVAHA